MNFLNLLASDPVIPFLGRTYDISLNWLGHLIRVLIEGIGVVGIGIIVFSIILRLVVLPFDIYQRVTMRKQNIKMKENKDKMEKLQKQYAGDKAMYNQKLMEMYKENGISMFSSCLPAIISLVVFIVAINAFNAFSQYANMQNYNLMANSYNEYLNPYCAELKAENIDDNYIITKENEDGTVTQTRHILVRETADSQSGKTKCIYYTLIYNENYDENDYRYIKDTEKTYYVDAERLYASSEKLENADGSATTWKERVDALVSASADTETPIKMENACREVLVSAAQDNVKHTYDTEVVKRMKFLWVKNIWATDATFKHPVLNYNDFKSSVSNGKFSVDGEKVKFANISGHTDAYNQGSYDVVTAKLSAEKSQFNGYYILIVLSIGTILLQQFVSMRSQKEQTQYSSVDGQGMMNQKMMLIIMTVMFAIFAFMYSAAFSIYMVTSNILSLIMTLVINKVVEIVMNKKEEKALQEQYNKRFPGRVYVPEKDKDKKAGKKNKK